MFRPLRTIHKWIGAILCLFLALISVTGFLLATKGTFGWVRPPEQKGAKVESEAELVSLDQVMQAVYALDNPYLKSMKDVDRIDYRPKSNIFKVVSKKGYQEAQVDGKTGKVLSVAYRTDQLSEDVHDLSFFSDALHDYGLPFVAIGLFTLAVTGATIFATPYFRRWKFNRQEKLKNVGGDPKEIGYGRR